MNENIIEWKNAGINYMKDIKNKNKFEYLNNPKKCKRCNETIPYEHRRNKFCCRSCSASFTQFKDHYCKGCSILIPSKRLWCSEECKINIKQKRKLEKQKKLIQSWKLGKITGLRADGTVCFWLKEYLRKKFEDKCCLCGWSKINPKTKKVPVVADHIDGNWRNNNEENLRLICPNCDSLQPTYCGSNRGKGRGQYKYHRIKC
jgi:predicted nucleic acid-binding Zn ribbon protein